MSKPRIVRIRRSDGASNFEEIMAELLGGECALSLPQSLEYGGGLGRTISLAQLIATWAQSSDEKLVYTSLPADDPDRHEKFVSRIYGFAAAYFSNSIFGAKSDVNIRRALLNSARPRIIAMSERRYRDVARGSLIELLFVRGAHHEFHSAVYERRPSVADLRDSQVHGQLVVSYKEMHSLFHKIVRELNILHHDRIRLRELLNDQERRAGHLLHETFRNTAEHAYLSVEGKIPAKGLRCILVTIHQADPREIRAGKVLSVDHPTASRYFEEFEQRAGQEGREHAFVLEISLLDSGPGFAATIGKEGDDVSRVKRCFDKYESAKGGQSSGLGLNRVLRAIQDLNGFARIRTATTEAFFSSLMDSEDCGQLRPQVRGGLPQAVGTAITIGIPLLLSAKPDVLDSAKHGN